MRSLRCARDFQHPVSNISVQPTSRTNTEMADIATFKFPDPALAANNSRLSVEPIICVLVVGHRTPNIFVLST